MATTVSINQDKDKTKTWYGDASALLYYLSARQKHKDVLDSVQIGINPAPHACYREVESIHRNKHGQWNVILNLPGLVGPIATLPQYDQVSLIANNAEQSHAVMDLFNIFHQRLISYRYITWLQKRPILNYQLPLAMDKEEKREESPHGAIGFNHQALAYLAGQPCDDSAITHFLQAQALVLRKRPLSTVVIEALLSTYFQMSIKLSTHVPSRCPIPLDEQTRLSSKSHCNQLGQETILGNSLWLCAQKSFLTIGPLSYQQFLSLIPGGKMLQQLKEMIGRLLPANIATIATLILKKEAIPSLCLTSKPYQLGWNSWLCSNLYQKHADDSRIRLT
jgi:type VI secretion system protein ImpH